MNVGLLHPLVTSILKRLGLLSAAGTNAAALGPSSSTDNAIARYDGTSGKLIQSSSVTIDDSGNVVTPSGAGVVVGGADTSGVKLKVDTGTLVVREGDDSAYTNLACARVQVLSGSTIMTDLLPGATGLSPDSILSWSNDVGLKRAAAGVLHVTDGSSGSGSLYVATGTTTVPSITTATDTDTGISIGTADNVLSFISGGAQRIIVGGAQINFNGSTTYNWASRLTAYTSDTTLGTTATQGVSTNEGAAGEVILTLPTAVAGLYTEAVVAAGQYLRLKAATGDTIRDAATVSAAAGYIRSNTQGSTIRLLAINATEWIVVAKQGTWTIDW